MRREAWVAAWMLAWSAFVSAESSARASSPPNLEPATSPTPAEPITEPAAVAGSSSAPTPAPSPPQPTIVLEDPYKLGERIEPRSKEAYKQEIRELRHWGAGGIGEPLEPLPGPEGHPDPRVIINVERVKGAHRGDELQRVARRNHWIQVIRCYRLGAYKDPDLRGWTKAVIGVSSGGAVRKTRLLDTQLKDRAVAECLVSKLAQLRFGKASASTAAWLELRVSPGDEPMPPPEELLVPGDGYLTEEAMRGGVRAGVPEFEACYRAGLRYAPGLWGRMLLRFHVTERGKLDEVFQSGTTFPDARVAQCVLRAARKLRFPKPTGGDIRFAMGVRFSSDRSNHALPPPNEPSRPSAARPQKRDGQD
jgi:hypothetical protein